DWLKAWQILKVKWSPYDVCTPDYTFNIDAKLNGAYVVMGLLYGKGDWFKTMEVTVRCGQDTDCNTATAAAVLGIIDGYDAIPDTLKSYIPQMADEKFSFTNYSYNNAVATTLNFIKENVENNGGKVEADKYIIKVQQPVAPQYEPGFPNIKMTNMVQMSDADSWKLYGNWEDFVYGAGDEDLYKVSTTPGDSLVTTFNGGGVALLGSWSPESGMGEVFIDGNSVKTFDGYYVDNVGKFGGNRAYLFYVFGLPKGDHTLKVVNLPKNSPRSTGNKIYVERMLVYE
ncbi:MAG: ADP-ribosylglycohydrolase family protein, partial [Muribaculaceae bacterium]|nr:ADP-ribosylglycohydrolase family protein [Muribaculaceae bacterium]